MGRSRPRKDAVLVGVLKTSRDRMILFRERWYRIPVASAPTRAFRYLAFYQPASFGRAGKRIQYYARVLRERVRPRRALLRREPRHPRARQLYRQFRVGALQRLPRPIRNVLPRRVSFGFTTLRRLHTATNLLRLYGVVPTERIIGRALERAGIPAIPQRSLSCCGKRYRLDFAIGCRRGPVAIECDNRRAHAGRRQRAKDRAKDVSLRRCGWMVLRLREDDIVARLDWCLKRVRRAIRRLGGLDSVRQIF